MAGSIPMKKRCILILGAALLMSTAASAETYDLSAFLDAVRAHNRDLQLAASDREMAALNKKEAASAALPTVGFETGYNYNFTDYYMYLDKSALGAGSGVIKAPYKRDNEFNAAIALEQTLFSPTVGKAITAAEQYRNMSGSIYDAAVQNVLAGAKKLFYQCLLLERVVAVSQSSEANAHENYRQTQLRYDNGQVSQLELLQAETRWRNAIPETQKAGRNWRLAMNTLKSLAGFDLTAEVTLAGSLDAIPALPDSVGADQVVGIRPDFQALDWERKLRKTAADAARDAYKPSLKGTVAYAYSAQSNEFKLDEENKFWYAGIKLSMPIYTGGAIAANVEKAEVERGKAGIRFQKNRETLSTDLQNVYLRMREAKLRIESAAATRSTAEKAFLIAETATREGLTTQLQLKDVRVMFDQAMINYYAAVYDYRAAYSDWELTVGSVSVKE